MNREMCGLLGIVLSLVVGCGADRTQSKSDSGVGFIQRTYHAANGETSNYVVFVPHDDDGTDQKPTILALHGAGQSGTDGTAQVVGGLAKAIRARERDFPFLVIFPQSRHGNWTAESPDGKLVIEILNEVVRDYRVDSSRVYLTGYSMGGEGTWSLAAHHPEHWAAIVPICPGKDRTLVDKLCGIPCWCFLGDADATTTVNDTRNMVRALQKRCGRPNYHEYPGVGHNCWDLAYADPLLYEWLLKQHKSPAPTAPATPRKGASRRFEIEH